MDGRDLVIIGGGVIGLATAWRAAQTGMTVTVADAEPGRGASWAAAGMLAPTAEAAYHEEALLEANLASQRSWPAFAAALEDASGHTTGYRECGTIVVARDGDEAAQLDRLASFREELGLGVVRLRGREARRLEPALAPGVRAGLECPEDHQVDNRAVVEALMIAARRAGVSFTGRNAVKIRRKGQRVTGLTLDDGHRLDASTVVVSAGAATGRVDGLADPSPPVRPVKGQLLHLHVPAGHPPLAERTIRGLDVYVVSRADGRVVVGATMEEQGFDRCVTAGGIHQLLRDAYELVPAVTECVLVEAIAGLRPGTPDNAPLIGALDTEGLFLATGHYRHGMLLAPLTADGVVELLTHGTVPEALRPFTPGRFATAKVGS